MNANIGLNKDEQYNVITPTNATGIGDIEPDATKENGTRMAKFAQHPSLIHI